MAVLFLVDFLFDEPVASLQKKHNADDKERQGQKPVGNQIGFFLPFANNYRHKQILKQSKKKKENKERYRFPKIQAEEIYNVCNHTYSKGDKKISIPAFWVAG